MVVIRIAVQVNRELALRGGPRGCSDFTDTIGDGSGIVASGCHVGVFGKSNAIRVSNRQPILTGRVARAVGLSHRDRQRSAGIVHLIHVNGLCRGQRINVYGIIREVNRLLEGDRVLDVHDLRRIVHAGDKDRHLVGVSVGIAGGVKEPVGGRKSAIPVRQGEADRADPLKRIPGVEVLIGDRVQQGCDARLIGIFVQGDVEHTSGRVEARGRSDDRALVSDCAGVRIIVNIRGVADSDPVLIGLVPDGFRAGVNPEFQMPVREVEAVEIGDIRGGSASEKGRTHLFHGRDEVVVKPADLRRISLIILGHIYGHKIIQAGAVVRRDGVLTVVELEADRALPFHRHAGGEIVHIRDVAEQDVDGCLSHASGKVQCQGAFIRIPNRRMSVQHRGAVDLAICGDAVSVRIGGDGQAILIRLIRFAVNLNRQNGACEIGGVRVIDERVRAVVKQNR